MRKNLLLNTHSRFSRPDNGVTHRTGGGYYLIWTLGALSTSILLISLMAIIHGCDPAAKTNGEVACNGQPLVPDQMSLVNLRYHQGKYLYNEKSDTIRVNVSSRQSAEFSYAIIDDRGQPIANGNLLPCDQLLDKEWEELFVPFPAGLSPGAYKLVFYNDRIQDTNSRVNGRSSYAILVE